MKLILNLKTSYGRSLFYPENETASKFCQLLGCVTLTKEQLVLIKSMGIEIEIQQEKIAI